MPDERRLLAALATSISQIVGRVVGHDVGGPAGVGDPPPVGADLRVGGDLEVEQIAAGEQRVGPAAGADSAGAAPASRSANGAAK